jgi:uncharacterized membrane protein YeaQ/YmgE (transglycosylase-associated protein family)
MDWLVIIVVGAIIGWLASLIMKTQMGIIVDIVVGIIGSILGKWLFADLLGIGGAAAAGTFSIMGIVWGVIGAIILLAILKAIGAFSK